MKAANTRRAYRSFFVFISGFIQGRVVLLMTLPKQRGQKKQGFPRNFVSFNFTMRRRRTKQGFV
jgi:hypothetical protein